MPDTTASTDKSRNQTHIESLVRQLNEAWLNANFEKLNSFFSDDVVIQGPTKEGRITGRDLAVESYRRFATDVTVHEFDAEHLLVEVFGSTAIAMMTFRIQYELDGNTYDDRGRDLMVFTQTDEGWKIVWRTQIP